MNEVGQENTAEPPDSTVTQEPSLSVHVTNQQSVNNLICSIRIPSGASPGPVRRERFPIARDSFGVKSIH